MRGKHFAAVTKCDALVLGGGIGGASVSYRLAHLHNLNVICLEKEAAPGYGATGKAIGMFAESNSRSRQHKLLTSASRKWFESPDEECYDDYIRTYFTGGILSKTGLLAISSPDDYAFLHSRFGPDEGLKFEHNTKVLTKADMMGIAPFLNPDELAPYAIYESTAANFHLGLAYEHFLVGGNNVGVNYQFNQSAVEIDKGANGNWEVMSFNAEENRIDRFEAGLLINCSGQWADETADKAGVTPLNLVPNHGKICAFTFKEDVCFPVVNKQGEVEYLPKYPIKLDVPTKVVDDLTDMKISSPWIGWVSADMGGRVFLSRFEGQNGLFLYSDALHGVKDEDEAPVRKNYSAQVLLEQLSKFTKLNITEMTTKKAGVQCSVTQDRNMVIGPAVDDDSFIWCAALANQGIQTAPAYSEITSYLAVGKPIPSRYVDLGIDLDKLLPKRLELETKQSTQTETPIP